jgi:hypothetical protein
MDLMLALALVVAAETCPDPASPCPGFREHDLSFMRETGGAARAEERSAPFFAVILVSGKACAIPEKERARIQKLFPKRKVFSSRFECDGDVENNVKYTNTSDEASFVAVHGSGSRAEADKVAAEARAKGFADANVREMQVVLVHP